MVRQVPVGMYMCVSVIWSLFHSQYVCENWLKLVLKICLKLCGLSDSYITSCSQVIPIGKRYHVSAQCYNRYSIFAITHSLWLRIPLFYYSFQKLISYCVIALASSSSSCFDFHYFCVLVSSFFLRFSSLHLIPVLLST